MNTDSAASSRKGEVLAGGNSQAQDWANSTLTLYVAISILFTSAELICATRVLEN